MRKPEKNARNGKGGLRTRIGAKALAGVATFALVASMCPGTVALAYANDQLTNGSISDGTTDLEAQAVRLPEYTVDANTHTMKTGNYRVKGDVTINPDATGNGIQIEKGATVFLIFEDNATLTVKGADATGNGIGHAAILLREGSTLEVEGQGTLNATGGRAGSGADGGAAEKSYVWAGSPSSTGRGGHGGAGGGGAGAGIGTDGGAGGAGGEGGEGVHNQGLTGSNIYGNDGKPGSWGSAAESAGTVLVCGNATVYANGGAHGEKGGSGGKRGRYTEEGKKFGYNTSVGTSGGGGGGAAGSAAEGIGPGGSGGGGGGGGASGSFDGEFAFFIKGDLDDLWGHGGYGGTSIWGASSGARGDEGASNGGDDTGASRKYARSGGAGGSCPDVKRVAFYTFRGIGGDNPQVFCKAADGDTRYATSLSSTRGIINHDKILSMVSGGSSQYDGNPHGATVNGSNNLNAQSAGTVALSAQAEGDEADSSPVKIDGFDVHYSIAYYDEEGEELDGEPTLPGQYAAVVTFWCDEPGAEDYNGVWAEQITITKKQVAKPTPAELTFECENWYTGEGALQDAFPGLDEVNVAFVPDAKAEDGAASVRSARAAGDYQACFRLTNPDLCEWADGAEGDTAWVPWSIKLAGFDPNDIMYWGPAYDNSTSTVAYTGDPIWVRPWYAYTSDADGEFPAWYTHWGSADRPTTDRLSACVVYLQGEEDYEGLVGYHTNADGTLEPVTGAQVYAWANGVDIDGAHVDVQSGDKVWYKTDEDGSLTVLAVQEAQPEGAEGNVVARDYAYADKLGVKDVGTYHAYALFDEGTGFETTSLAEATVEVVPADAAAAKASSTKAATPKTGDFSPFVIGGVILVALLAAGMLVFVRVRRLD